MQRRILGVAVAMAMVAGTAAAQTPAAPQLSVGGVAYAQWNYNLSGDQHLNAFDVTRTYLNFNGKFAGGVSTRVTPDIYRNADGSLGYRLKYGYVAYQPKANGITWKFGLIQTPWVGREEDLWGYRMQGSIAVDRAGVMSSADFGLSADAKLANGRFDLNAGVYNGEGYKTSETDQRKDFMVRGSYLLSATDDNSATGGLRLSGYAGIGKAAGGVDRDRYIGQLSYATTRYTLAGEYVSVTNGDITGSIISAFGVYRLSNSKWALIGRVDQYDPDTDTSDDASTRIIGGASYQVSPNLRVLGDVDLLSHEAGDPDLAVDPRNQALVQLQFTF
ncbi:MAG TPA: hypothetical protein VG940_01020 [Gemmatimonadales bacterium]|nr:hypothetical protein [Gemmatimonadales bacterium]